jgi:hypothetical protein
MDNRSRTITIIILAMIMFIAKCISPTYECAQVRKGNHGWCGFSHGFRTCDYYNPMTEESGVDTRALIGSMGFTHGFNEYNAIYLNCAFYSISSKNDYDAQSRKSDGYGVISFGIKAEPTLPTSPVSFSFATGLALFEGWETRIMLGFKGTGHRTVEDSAYRRELISIGTDIILVFPTDVFANLRPFSNSGVVLYAGYRFPYFYPSYSEDIKAKNFAVGIGYEW